MTDYKQTKTVASPLISVIMSTYNETKDQLVRSIDSILNQTVQDFEFIIVVDNPSNKTIDEVLNGYSSKKIRVIRNEVNIGLPMSLNKAILEAKGKYIARMDADDESLKDRLKIEMDYLQEHDLDHVGSFVNLMDENGNIYGKTILPIKDVVIKEYLRCGSPMAHPTWFLKKEVFDRVGLYRKHAYTEDFDFLLREKKNGVRFGNVPEFLLNYTIRKNSISRENTNQQFRNLTFLLDHYNDIERFDEQGLADYIESKEYQQYIKTIDSYQECASNLRNRKELFSSTIRILFNRYLYILSYRRQYKKLLDLISRIGGKA